MLAITLLGISRKSPITPLSIVVVIMIAMAQYGRHLSAIPAPLLTMSGPTGWRAAAIPALRSDGAAGSRRACAADSMAAGTFAFGVLAGLTAASF